MNLGAPPFASPFCDLAESFERLAGGVFHEELFRDIAARLDGERRLVQDTVFLLVVLEGS